MKYRMVGDCPDSDNPDITSKYYVRYDTIEDVLRKVSLNKLEQEKVREWAEDAKPGDMLTVRNRRESEWVLVVAINEAGSVSKIAEQSTVTTVLDKLVDPDDRPRAKAARKSHAKRKSGE